VRQNATPEPECDDDAAPELTPAQVVALAALAGGGSVSDAADAAGVHRATVYRWLDDDAGFIAELNRFRSEQRARLSAQVHELGNLAIGFVRGVLDGTETLVPKALRLRAALAVLGRAGVLEPEPAPGPTHPDDIRAEWGGRATVRRLYRTPEP
jgi:AcrR family transcriptional regulator